MKRFLAPLLVPVLILAAPARADEPVITDPTQQAADNPAQPPQLPASTPADDEGPSVPTPDEQASTPAEDTPPADTPPVDTPTVPQETGNTPPRNFDHQGNLTVNIDSLLHQAGINLRPHVTLPVESKAPVGVPSTNCHSVRRSVRAVPQSGHGAGQRSSSRVSC
jgi:hypothetical protein